MTAVLGTEKADDMQMTVADLKRVVADMPDDAKVFIEYPQHGLLRRDGVEVVPLVIGQGSADETNVIVATSYAKEPTALYILHHF